MEPMLIVEEAQDRVLKAFKPLGATRVPILDAVDRFAAEDVWSDVDIPPHDNSSMDGYAVQAADTAGATSDIPITLTVIGDLPAGYVPEREVLSGTAVRIMTGAPLPPGADAVVKVEDTASVGEDVDILAEVAPGNYVRLSGEDVRRGSLILPKGTRLRSQEIGMLAALGRPEIAVGRRPRVAVLATGDELVAIDESLAPGKIRNANSYSNAAQIAHHGGEPVVLGIARDTVEELTARIEEGLRQGVDLFLTSGGVSVGRFDLVKDVLAAQGSMDFWRVRMKPGKPLAFGRLDLPSEWDKTGGGGAGATTSIPILGLPGNPVSVMVSFEMFVRPALLKMQGARKLRRPTVEATLMDEIEYKDERRHYVRVQLVWEEDEYHAYLTGDQGSGILSSMLKANALAVIPEDWDHAPAGARVEAMMLD